MHYSHLNLDLSNRMNAAMQQLQGLRLHIVNTETENNLGTFDRSYLEKPDGDGGATGRQTRELHEPWSHPSGKSCRAV
jgi:hypothetical protein